jgi:hypothetical protein
MCKVKEIFAGLSGNATKLLLHLILHADDNGVVEVSERRLAKDLDMGRQQLRTAKQSLLEHHRITQQVTQQVTHLTLCCCGSCKASKTTKQPKQPAIEIAPEWVSQEFAPVFLDWLEYKRSRREGYKTDRSLKACYNMLVNLSGGNAEVAARIVEQSMANNWKGLFPLKDNNNGKTDWRVNRRDNELAAQAVRMRTDFESKRACQ